MELPFKSGCKFKALLFSLLQKAVFFLCMMPLIVSQRCQMWATLCSPTWFCSAVESRAMTRSSAASELKTWMFCWTVPPNTHHATQPGRISMVRPWRLSVDEGLVVSLLPYHVLMLRFTKFGLQQHLFLSKSWPAIRTAHCLNSLSLVSFL